MDWTGTIKGKRHSEFQYGSLTQSLILPANPVEYDVTASCRDGILTVSTGLKTVKEQSRRSRSRRRS